MSNTSRHFSHVISQSSSVYSLTNSFTAPFATCGNYFGSQSVVGIPHNVTPMGINICFPQSERSPFRVTHFTSKCFLFSILKITRMGTKEILYSYWLLMKPMLFFRILFLLNDEYKE